MLRLVGVPVRGTEPVVHDGAEFFDFLGGLFFPAHIAGLGDPGVEGGTHFGEGFLVLGAGGVDEVGQLVGIGLGVVKIFAAKLGEEGLKVRIELAPFIKLSHDLLHGETFFLIKIHVSAEVDFGLVVADVMVALAADGAQAELDIIHAITRAEGVAALGIAVFAEEIAALHAERARDAGE